MLHLVTAEDLILLTDGCRKYRLSYYSVWPKLVSRQLEGEQIDGRWWVSDADLKRLSRQRAAQLQPACP